jgi:hypothetical protein
LRRKKRVTRESNIIQRDNWGNKIHTARTIAERNPTLGLKSLSPKIKMTKRMINPAKADGRRLANSLFSPRKKVEKLTNQKKSGGFSA